MFYNATEVPHLIIKATQLYFFMFCIVSSLVVFQFLCQQQTRHHIHIHDITISGGCSTIFQGLNSLFIGQNFKLVNSIPLAHISYLLFVIVFAFVCLAFLHIPLVSCQRQ